MDRFESYLGLPTLVGWKKYHTFSFLKDRVWKKLQGWRGQTLSRVGKEILIKAVAQSIPTYTMGVFQLPVKLCEELQALCARFWWGQIGNEKEEWGSRTCDNLIWLCLQNKVGDCCKIKSLYSLSVLKHGISLDATFWKPLTPSLALSLERVPWQPSR